MPGCTRGKAGRQCGPIMAYVTHALSAALELCTACASLLPMRSTQLKAAQAGCTSSQQERWSSSTARCLLLIMVMIDNHCGLPAQAQPRRPGTCTAAPAPSRWCPTLPGAPCCSPPVRARCMRVLSIVLFGAPLAYVCKIFVSMPPRPEVSQSMVSYTALTCSGFRLAPFL